VHLYPASRHQAVAGGEDDLLGVVGVRGGQDDLARPGAVSRGQEELLLLLLLLGTTGRVHGCNYLDLLTNRLLRYNLQTAERGKETTWLSFRQPLLNQLAVISYLAHAALVCVCVCVCVCVLYCAESLKVT